jgi:hypothetical protein
MSQEKNPLNAYNQFETIKKAVDQLETIHVYEVNARQWGDTDTPSLKAEIADLDKKVYEYELQLAELQKYSEELEIANKSLLKANNVLVDANKILSDNTQTAESTTDKIVEAYSKLPRIIKKFYGPK